MGYRGEVQEIDFRGRRVHVEHNNVWGWPSKAWYSIDEVTTVVWDM
jgi:hypothetical protein